METTEMVATAEKTFGALDILVNNAGIQHVAPIEKFPIEKWDAIIAINLSASFHSIRAAVPEMKRRKWGRIVNIASAHGLVASFRAGDREVVVLGQVRQHIDLELRALAGP